MSEELSPHARSWLEEAGWREGRTVDIEPVVNALKRVGFPVPHAVASFLQAFDGLKIRCLSTETPGRHAVLYIGSADDIDRKDPLEAVAYVGADGTPLCFVADLAHTLYGLYMDDRGQVYIDGLEETKLFAVSGIAALNVLCGEDQYFAFTRRKR